MEAGRSVIPLVKSFVAHHRGAGPGNLRPVFIVRQQICVCFPTLCRRLGAFLRPRRRRALLYLGDAPEQPATALGLGTLDLLPERERRGGRAVAAWLWSAGSSGVQACQRAGTGGEEQAHAMSLPQLNRGAQSPAAHGVRARSDLRRGWELPRGPCGPGRVCFCSAAEAGVCGYRCALPLLPPWATSD